VGVVDESIQRLAFVCQDPRITSRLQINDEKVRGVVRIIKIALPFPVPSVVYKGGYRRLIVFTSPAAILAPVTLVLC